MRFPDLYTKVVLTVIAALLVWNTLGRFHVPAVHAQSTSAQYSVEEITAGTSRRTRAGHPLKSRSTAPPKGVCWWLWFRGVRGTWLCSRKATERRAWCFSPPLPALGRWYNNWSHHGQGDGQDMDEKERARALELALTPDREAVWQRLDPAARVEGRHRAGVGDFDRLDLARCRAGRGRLPARPRDRDLRAGIVRAKPPSRCR